MNEFFLNLSAFDIFAQCVGFCGTICFFIGFQQKKRKKIILMQLFGILFFTAHFFLLGAYTGAMMNFLGLLRAFVYYNDNKKWAQNKAWFYGFMISYLVIGIITWENFFSLFPIIAMLLT
ncbi:MAG: YgjV family protein, partial [Christensenella sp.]